MVKPLEHYDQTADERALRVVDTWWRITGEKPSEFEGLYDKALTYQRAKRWNDDRRAFGALAKEDEIRESEARLAFATACKTLDDSAPPLPAYAQAIVDHYRVLTATEEQ